MLTFTVDKGPFTISTKMLPKGARLAMLFTPTDAAISPIAAAPSVQRVIAGTQTHLASKPPSKRR